MKKGSSPSKIEAMLVEKGIERSIAHTVMANLTKMRSEALRKAGQSNMLQGVLWCVGGILVTAITYMIASRGGVYVVTWGAVLFGAIQFFRGLLQAFQA
jgi:hypothetical protein